MSEAISLEAVDQQIQTPLESHGPEPHVLQIQQQILHEEEEKPNYSWPH